MRIRAYNRQSGTFTDQLGTCVALLSRLPSWSQTRPSTPATADVLRFGPVVGVAVAVLQSAVLVLFARLGLPTLAVATLVIAVGIGVTGALHEDGLADVADGFGGGFGRDRKLAIMRDSRIGTYGALAVGCNLLVRSATFSSLVDRSGLAQAAAALLVAATFSRGLMLLPLTLLPPARPDGLAQGLGPLPRHALWTALALAAVLGGAGALASGMPLLRLGIAGAAAAATSLGFTLFANRQIGGHTGDVIGACQQICEMTVLLALAANPGR